ncbi:lipoate--protein ligase family protein [Rarobacter faecitabidus]|uniref:Lipoate-protein ligase A n=1 Tax=Rarobacter faecitabidus TaxID=13243 RepID=A0A542ZTD6_RARFA|nr:biotin/lipoate A/B protein ligase family protein [Rarobacter faecitabidus]TQL63624.1 lipoate-protein ligase A [Rarobacter faecitabidus]
MRGEYKVPGGKLVAVDLDVTGDRLVDVHVSGDFFLDPDEALAVIDRALVGQSADAPSGALAAAITEAIARAEQDAAFGVPVTMVGFDAHAVAMAVRRALGHASGWQDHTFDFLDTGTMPPPWHAALDEVLGEETAAGRRGPSLRFWYWDSAAVVIGSFQSLRNEVDAEAARELDVEVVRRISGGGAMFMEANNCITFSLVVPASLVDGMSFEQSYAFLDDWVLEALGSVGVQARYAGLNDIASPAGKIAGAAQKRFAPRDGGPGAVLHHVTMAYDIDADKMLQVLRIGREKLSDKGTKSANKRVDPVRSQTHLPRDEVIAKFLDTFRARYPTVDGELTAAELSRTDELMRSKFRSPEWTARVP